MKRASDFRYWVQEIWYKHVDECQQYRETPNDSIQKLATELVNIFPTRADKLSLTIDAVMQDQLRAIETELGLHG